MRTVFGQIATHAGSDARCILSSVSGHASGQSVSMPQDEALSVALVLSDGGSFSNEYSASNVFVDDGSVYCSVSVEGVNLVARCTSSSPSATEVPSPSSSPGSNNSPFTLTSVVVRVPPSGFTSPLGQAIIFTSWDFPDLDAIKCFDSVRSQRDYDRLAGTCGSSGNSSSSGRSSRDEMEAHHAADHPDTPSSSSSEMQVHPAADPADSPSSSSDDSMDEGLVSDREQQVAQQLAWLLTGQSGPLSHPLPQSQDQDQGLLGQCDWAPWLPGLPPPLSLLRQPTSVVTTPALAMLPPWMRAARGALPLMPKDLPVSDASLPVPRLFIDMGASSEARFALPSPASGRFVVVKMLRSRSSGADNIDVQYIGLRGLTQAPRFAAGVVL